MNWRVAIVTGGASGLGAAFCRALRRGGAKVVIADIDVRNRADYGVTADLDVRDGHAFRALIQKTKRDLGSVDLLINNAGILAHGLVEGIPAHKWRDVIDTNLHGAINGSLAALPVMREQQRGRIVNVASLSGLLPMPLYGPYVASKWAVVGFSRALALELAGSGVGVSVACPGNINTPMLGTSFRGSWLMPVTSADAAADKILRATHRGRSLIVFPAYARLMWWAERLNPQLLAPLHRLVIARHESRLTGEQSVQAQTANRR